MMRERPHKAFVLESNFFSGWTAYEQENYPVAEGFLRETFRVTIRQWNAEEIVERKVGRVRTKEKIGFREFLSRSGDSTLSGLDETRGYIALRIDIFYGGDCH